MKTPSNSNYLNSLDIEKFNERNEYLPIKMLNYLTQFPAQSGTE
jgi:hypothetical protein